MVYLDNIETAQGTISLDFEYTEKNDLSYPFVSLSQGFQVFPNTNKGHKLTSIGIKYNNVLKKKFDLDYIDESSQKLKLLSINQISPTDATKSVLLYSFTYSSEHSSYSSWNTDHWGFYNGNHGGLLSEALKLDGRYPIKDAVNITEFPDILESITYPTGGKTTFTYESNTFSKVHDNPNHNFKQLHSYSSIMSGSKFYQYIDNPELETESFTFNCSTYVYVQLVFTSNHGPACYCNTCGCKFTLYYPPGTYKASDFVQDALYSRCSMDLHETDCENPGRVEYDPYWDGNVYEARYGFYYYENAINEYIGGARVKKVENFDPINQLTTTRTYEYTLDDGVTSSGVISSFPQYEKTGWVINRRRHCVIAGSCSEEILYPSIYYYSAKPVYPLAFSSDAHVGYSRVIEKYDNGAKKIFNYTTFEDSPDVYPAERSVMEEPQDRKIGRGRLTSEHDYKEGSSATIEESSYLYDSYFNLNQNYMPNHVDGSRLQILGQKYMESNNVGVQIQVFNLYYIKVPFFYDQQLFQLKSVSEELDGVTKTTNYQYHPENHTLLRVKSEKTAYSSKSTETNYVCDYNSSIGSSFISKMKNNYMINYPIERTTYSYDYYNKTGGITFANMFQYSDEDNKLGLLTDEYSFEAVVPKYDFAISTGVYNLDLSNFDPDYVKSYDYSYTTDGRLKDWFKVYDVNNSYLWGYNHLYPIIEATNTSNAALEASVDNILTNLGYAGLDDIDVFLSDLDKLDDVAQKNLWFSFNTSLRSSLSGALITTRTFNPIIGVTSITDNSNIIEYYEYDDFGRLFRIVDSNENILKEYQYHFKE